MKTFCSIIVVLTFNLCFAQEQRFIIGAEHVSGMAEYNTGSLPHSPGFWNNVKDFGLNWVGLKYFQQYSNFGYHSKQAIINDISMAEDRNIDVYLFNGFLNKPVSPWNLYIPCRWLYQIEYVLSNTLNDFYNVPTGEALSDRQNNVLPHWNLFYPPEDQLNYLHLETGLHNNGIIASDLRQKTLQPDGLNYYLKVRMRLPSAVTFPNTDVLTVRVRKVGGSTYGRTIKANEFNNNDWKEILVTCFFKMPTNPDECIPDIDETDVYELIDSISTNQLPNAIMKEGILSTDYDIEIEWHATGFSVDLDYVAIDNEDANFIMPPQEGLADRIEDFVETYKNHGVLNFHVYDEVNTANLYSVRYFNNKIQTILNNSLMGYKDPLSYLFFVNTNPPHGPTTKRYIWESDAQLLMSDIYPIWKGDIKPNQPGYSTLIQDILQERLIDINWSNGPAGLKSLAFESQTFHKPFIYTVEAHLWDRIGEEYTREPSAYEIKAMANLGVCYGAKGITYYLYAHLIAEQDEINGFYFHDSPVPDGSKKVLDAYDYPKWETIKQLNQKLAILGDDLLSLTWKSAYSIHKDQFPADSYITDIHYPSNINFPDCNQESNCRYIELGLFKKTDEIDNLNKDYFYLVNRRTLPSETVPIQITINKTLSNPNNYQNWGLKEIGTTNSWTVQITGMIEPVFQPGEGKLFSLQPVVIGGGTLKYNETITGTVTLSNDLIIDDSSVLTVAGTYNAYDDIIIRNGSIAYGTNGKINFYNGKKLIIEGNATLQGTSAHKLELDFMSTENNSGIMIEEGGNLVMSYCTVKNASKGIEASANFSRAYADHCEFTDCGNYSIAIYGIGIGEELPFTPSPSQISNCTISGSVYGISVVLLPEIVIQGNTISDTELGIYLSNVTRPYIADNTIWSTKLSMPGIMMESCNGIIVSNSISGHLNGIHCGNSFPDIGSNEIIDNQVHGLYAGTGSIPNLSGRPYNDPPKRFPISGYNTIYNNGGWETPPVEDNDGSEIYLNESFIYMDNGCNSVVDNRMPDSGPLVNTLYLMNGSGQDHEINCIENHWGRHPEYRLEDRFGHLSVRYIPFREGPCAYQPDQDELYVKSSIGEIIDTTYSALSSSGSYSTTEILYSSADKMFIGSDFTNAANVYNQVISGIDSLRIKLPAYRRLYEIGRLTNKPVTYFDSLYNSYTSIAGSTEDTLLQKIFTQLGSLSLIGQTEYISAIDEFDQIIQTRPNTEEAVYAEIDAMTTALLLEDDSTLNKTSAAKYIKRTSSEYLASLDKLIRTNFGNNPKPQEIVIPTAYLLYQNYPNPFNPTTRIRYDLPEVSRVSCSVYDLLGRKVKDLEDNQLKQPGSYELTFDASGLSSGIYFYRITANQYVSAKKMVVIK